MSKVHTRNHLLEQARKRIEWVIESTAGQELSHTQALSIQNHEFVEKKYGNRQYEDYRDNQLYGKGVLYRYTNQLKYDSKIHFVIPHGITPSEIVWSKEIATGLPIACFSDYAKFTYQKVCHQYNTNSMVFSSIHPFIKLIQAIEREKPHLNTNNIQQETNPIFFPLHSTKAIASHLHQSVEKAVNSLESLLQIHRKINLCIYYIDYQNLLATGNWNNYREKFDKVYCCGSRYEPAFLVNLALILKQHKLLITEGVGSHVLYGVMAGLDISLSPYNEYSNTYKFDDTAKSRRKDKDAREKNLECFAELHRLINSNQSNNKIVIERFFNKYLTQSEETIHKKVLETYFPDSHYAFTDDFHKHIYPLVG